MRLLVPVVFFLLLPIPAGADQKTAPRTKPAVTTLTGCLDETPGEQFVLLDPGDMRQSAALEADGFPNTRFAQFLGHTVRVTGQKKGDRLKVSKITSLSQTCAPVEPDSK